jgi:hypothetical protein
MQAEGPVKSSQTFLVLCNTGNNNGVSSTMATPRIQQLYQWHKLQPAYQQARARKG